MQEVHWSFHKRGGEFEIERTADRDIKRFVVDYALGSGHHATTFVTVLKLDPPRILEHRLTYYAADGVLGITPGQDQGQPKRGTTRVGCELTASETMKCLGCHATELSGRDSSELDPSTMIPGVSCERCHGPEAVGGVYATSITDDAGKFVANVSWKAPALTAVLTRFSEDEVTDVLNYGRNGVMPAWGAPGGGPLTSNQIKDLIIYLRTVQLPEEKMRASVDGGIREGAKAQLLADRPELQAALDAANRLTDAKAKAAAVDTATKAIDTALDSYLATISDPASPLFGTLYGKLVFNNTAAQGAYSCARCHTKGWSYGATQVTNTAGVPLEAKYVDGNGWFGPSLLAGSTTRKFNTAATHEAFITAGSEKGKKYGNAGVGDGQMPGFGARIDDTAKVTYPAILTENEIKAVVAYERGMQ